MFRIREILGTDLEPTFLCHVTIGTYRYVYVTLPVTIELLLKNQFVCVR
jgi:hypothetical protein